MIESESGVRTMRYARLSTMLCLAAALAACGPSGAEEKAPTRESNKADVVYVPTPHDVVMKMLALAKVAKDDLVYDLGCGDGRIVVLAAKKYGCKGVGYDIDPQRIKESRANAKSYSVAELVDFRQEDIFTLDLSKVNVVTLYLLPSLNVKLIPQLEKLKPGSRIVSHDFDMKGVKPDKVVSMISKEDNVEHTIYLWTTPLKKEKEKE
jgi:SAM-dependent methyltransferase